MLGKCKGRKRRVNKLDFARVVGYCSSVCMALPRGRFHLTKMYHDLCSVADWGKNTYITVSHGSVKELQHYWLRPTTAEVGRSWFPPHRTAVLTSQLVTDASKYAWGAHFHYATSAGADVSKIDLARGTLTED